MYALNTKITPSAVWPTGLKNTLLRSNVKTKRRFDKRKKQNSPKKTQYAPSWVDKCLEKVL